MNPKTLALIEAARAKHAAMLAAKQAANEAPTVPVAKTTELILATLPHRASQAGMVFNEEQMQAIELGLQGKSFCLIGAAGTGKTTVTQELISRLQQAAHMRPLADSTKHLAAGAPAIVICGYTNKAVNNIRKKLPTALQSHCITIHKLLEYAPVYYEVVTEDGSIKNTMRFEPSRFAGNPLPHISTIIFEESSMIGTELFGEVLAALPRPAATQFIFLGDLNQLPPVFGPSILGFKLADLQTVELKTVYRQALLSPIISLATAIRTAGTSLTNNSEESISWKALFGKLTETIKEDANEHGNVTLHPWKKRIDKGSAMTVMKSFIPKIIDNGEYNPEEDMILCPFNKSFGTVELNKVIANHITQRDNRTVFEVIARYNKSYWAVGDRVLVDRHEAVITKITPTVGYIGKLPLPASTTLDRWGHDPKNPDSKQPTMTADQILNELDRLAGAADEESKNLASHTIEVYIPDTDVHKTIDSAGDINSMLLGYCLTVHKSQGSEWQKVFIFLHNSHSTMLSRELLYTAVTRAKHSLYVICEGDVGGYNNSIKAASQRPIVPGTTLPEKIAYFRQKMAEQHSQE